MCGIYGVWNYLTREPINRNLIKFSTRTMFHRGPDDEGYYVDETNGLGLGFRRLSIIDLTASGHQPMSNEDGSVWLVFNGEIYNFRALRPHLESAGHVFRSNTDSEVILHLYEERGLSCVQELNGMFSFAIWDQRLQRLVLARDRVGKKPLYYYDDGKRLVFASELKAILADSSVPREPEYRSIGEYMALGYISSPSTILHGIKKLPPGSHMVFEKEHAVIGRYWDWLPAFRPNTITSEAEWIEQIRNILRTVVNDRLVSDVPLGAFLSGGIDSSAVVGMMAELAENRVKTFSIGFEDAAFNELPYARVVSQNFGTDHHEHIVEPEALREFLPHLVKQFDEPFADPSALPTYYVSKIARQQVTVCLSGDGGDESMAGYTRYAQALQEHKMDFIPLAIRAPLFSLTANLLPLEFRGQRFFQRMALPPSRRYISALRGISAKGCNDLLTAESLNLILGHETDCMETHWKEGENLDLLSRIQYIDGMCYLPEDILVKVDRTSMWNSLEVRCPLLDYRFMELMSRIPSNLRLMHGQGKYIFKKAMKGFLPDAILNRPKQGFNIPLRRWFHGDLNAFAEEVLLDSNSLGRGIFKPKSLKGMINNNKSGSRALDTTIWTLLILELWWHALLD